jgi:mRNA interferase RelE/StbE
MFKIEYSRESLKSLKLMPSNVSKTIRGKIEQLASDPFASNNNVKKLEGRPGFRLRVGDWRVIYEIQNNRLVIFIVAVAPRGGAYK